MPANGWVDFTIDVGAQLGPVPPPVRRQIEQELAAFRRQWRERLLTVWPVDTGRSLQGWQNKISGLTWILRNPVSYAEFVHVAGTTTQVWQYLEGFALTLIAGAMPRWRALARAAQDAGIRTATPPSPAQQPQAGGVADLFFRARAMFNRQTDRGRRRRDRARTRER